LSQVYSAGPALPSALVAAASVQGPSADAQTQRITSPAVIAAELDINRIFLDAALPSLGPGDDAYNLDPDHRLIGRARGPIAYPLMDLSGDPFVALVSPSTPRVARAGVPDPLGSGSRVVASAPFPLSATYSFVVSRDTSQEDRELEAALGQRANLRLGIVAALLALAYFIGNATKQSTLRAVYEERLRLARDLHDLLGHSLSVITLKAQVARRSLGSGDAGRGATEIAEIERVARESLQDVRGAIDGYRQPSFGSALAGARAALAAAGIDSSLENAAGPLPIAVDATFAWILREAVTNVIRHSRAARCSIRLTRAADEALLEVVDDGTSAPATAPGNGLRGLRERAVARGGHADVGPLPGGGFRVQVSIPV